MKRIPMIVAALALAVNAALGAGWSRSSSDSAAAVAPFVGADTFLVVRGDVSQFDVRAVFSKADEFAQRMVKDDYGPKERRQLQEAEREASRWVSEFTRAGGREIYLVLGLADMNRGPFVVVPAGGGVDAEAIMNLLTTGQSRPPVRVDRDGYRKSERPMPMQPVPLRAQAPSRRDDALDVEATAGPGPEERTDASETARPPSPEAMQASSGPFSACRQIRGAVVAGSSSTLSRLEQMQPAPRPELARAFEATRGGLVQAALIPPAAVKLMLAQSDVTLPPEMGIRSLGELAEGFAWAAARAEGPPRLSIDLVIQASDRSAARALGQAVDNLFRWIEKTKPEPLGTTRDLYRVLNMFRPSVSGDQLTLSLSSSDIDEILFVHLAGPIAEAKKAAKRAVGMSHVRSIVMACHAYASDNNDQWPKDLQALDRYLGSRDVLQNPDDPSRSVGYGYIRPPRQSTIESPSERLVVYELREDWTRGVTVGFADRHVERITDREKFRKLLDEARRNAAKD